MTAPELAIRRIYEPPQAGDGLRILVDRLWPRGLAKADAALQGWCKEIAPSAPLRRWFGHDPARWDEFRRRYRAELEANPATVQALRDSLHGRRATLLYAARDEERNNAVVLREFLQRH